VLDGPFLARVAEISARGEPPSNERWQRRQLHALEVCLLEPIGYFKPYPVSACLVKTPMAPKRWPVLSVR
jgi:hypothetical protein